MEAGHPHLRHLEQARAQMEDLLTRQALERDLVSRAESRKQDVVASLVARQQQAAVEQKLAQFHPADVAFVLQGLPPDLRLAAWRLVRPERRGAVLLESSDAVRRAVISDLPADEVAAVLRPLDSDDIADLVGELPEAARAAVLAQLDQSDQVEVRSMLSFPDGTVGAEMDLDYVGVRDDTTLEAVQRYLRRRANLPSHTVSVFVTDRGNVLKGILPLTDLLLGDPDALVGAVMKTEFEFFHTDDRLSDAVAAFERYDLIVVPVVNLQRQVVGRLTVDSVLDTINQRVQRQRLEEVGLSEDQDLYTPVRTAARARWGWLALNLCTAFIASRVVGAFEHVIGQLVALAALMPIVASIGGNTGNQTVALVIRGLALNQLGPAALKTMFRKELAIAAFNGVVWGAAMALVTLLIYGLPDLALVIAAAMLLNLLVAAGVGMLAPVILERLGRDPVRGSSIILTFATDSMGFLIFLGLAGIFLV